MGMTAFWQYGTDYQKSNAIIHPITYLRHLRCRFILFLFVSIRVIRGWRINVFYLRKKYSIDSMWFL